MASLLGETREFQSSSKIGLNGSVITWELNYKTGSFTTSATCYDSKLNQINAISEYEDLLLCFGNVDKNRINNYLRLVMNDKPAQPVRVIFSFDEVDMMYCVLKAEKLNSQQLTGSIILLFTLPKHSQLSALFLNIFNNQHHGMVVTDKNSHIVATNQFYEKTMGYELDELLGKKTNIFKSDKLDDTFYTDMWSSLHYYGYWNGVILSKRKDGTIIPQQLTLQALNFSEHSVYYLGITRDLSGVADKLIGQVFGGVELVTQLPDEKHFVANLNRSLSKQSQDEIVYVAVLEPDVTNSMSGNFKSELSKCIEQYGKHFCFGYLGDNKFALSGSVSLKKSVKNTLKVILSQIRQLNAHLKQQLSTESVRILTRSKIGISYRDASVSDGGKLIFEACCSLKEQHQAFGQIHVYDSLQHHQYLRRRKLEIIARKAIKGRLVEVYYQPIIDTSSWRVVKFEALCRFRDRNGAILNTQEVVKIVESLGLVHELDLIVAEKAINDREILAQRFGKDIGLTINISLDSSNKTEALLLNLKKLIHREKDKFRYVTVEITESAYFNQNSDDSEITELLKRNDIRVAIDDFGTGYSSFSYLKEQTFDIVKIDQEFVSDLSENSRNYHIIRMIVKLAKVLNVKTVAEGVESKQVALLLNSMGVDMLQGYLFSKPMPLEKCNSISNLLYKIKKEVGLKEIDTIIDNPMTLTPDNDLEDVKQLFAHTDINYLPVISKNQCLGVVNRVNYSKAIPPTLDTPVENIRDRKVLKKKVSQIMETKFVTVNENISTYEVLELINEQAVLPWIVVNDSMQFIGLVEARGLLRLTTSLI